MARFFSVQGRWVACFFWLTIFLGIPVGGGGAVSPVSADDAEAIDKIVSGIETRYGGIGFTADFDQQSILKAMDVTDTASGRMIVRRPNRMRWEYKTPDPQIIIASGNTLWIHRPDENQAMMGKAPDFFSDGKGAGFLADIPTIRKNFHLFLDSSDDPSCFRLRMVPNTTTEDVMAVYLDVDKADFNVRRVITTNAYGDETRIDFKNVNLEALPPDALFQFAVPPGTDVIQMDQ
ncbi:outer membrane lipoprotein carrier protein LolA [Desulfosarcina sp. OttesenSCG-928-A07]|nr:outer membrane lipoprotein carrier protein LolA [Desulfosarcina sp. OttesenSCG-928-G17]MDL2330097.1 outer membrane lipoprotein carrier protein LolA [Desulfosarcina sp. OttesenSCG-928-A07]